MKQQNGISTRFKKGQSGNPNGRPKMPPELRAAIKVSKVDFASMIEELVYLTNAQLKKRIKSPDANQIEQIVIRFILESKKTGAKVDYLKVLLDRWLGKVKEEKEVKVSGTLDTILDIIENND